MEVAVAVAVSVAQAVALDEDDLSVEEAVDPREATPNVPMAPD